MPITDYGFVRFPGHMDFINLMVEAQKDANKVGEVIVVYWRGYRCKVNPNLPDFSDSELEYHLVTALQRVSDPSASHSETQVIKINYAHVIIAC